LFAELFSKEFGLNWNKPNNMVTPLDVYKAVSELTGSK
jgi:hypothetical protein